MRGWKASSFLRVSPFLVQVLLGQIGLGSASKGCDTPIGSLPGVPPRREAEHKCPGPLTSPCSPAQVRSTGISPVCICVGDFPACIFSKYHCSLSLAPRDHFLLHSWKSWDSISPETPYKSLPNVFQMLGLGTRSEVFQIIISTTRNLFSLQSSLEKKDTLLGFSSTGGWGRAMIKMGGPDKLETEHQNLLVRKDSRSTMSSVFPSNMKYLSAF